MDGLLIVDKPPGPTSHDVVARARRVLRQPGVGHTGTLDPMASGVLPLVLGRATRLARFLPGDKTYEAVIRLGFSTDTYDALGQPTPAPSGGVMPDSATIAAALEPFRGTFLQQPPVFSAKKIAGERSYAAARRAARAGADGAPAAVAPPMPRPVEVTAHQIDLVAVGGDLVTLRVRCAAGFYIRSLANDLGVALGTGAHLVGLRRTAAAGFGLDRALALDRLDAPDGAERAADALIPMDGMLAALPPVVLTGGGVDRVRVGRDIGPADAAAGFDQALAAADAAGAVRLMTPDGGLAAVARTGGGLLHPSIVLI